MENKLGVITKKYINIEKHLPIIFDLMGELIERFNSDYIHVGCDEAKDFEHYHELIDKISNWVEEYSINNLRKIKFIVWDDVVSKLTTIPDNMIVHRWRHYTIGKIKSLNLPYILSEGYYLDKCSDPIFLSKQNPYIYGGNLLGWIACTWSELIDNNNFYNTIVPSIYVLANVWENINFQQQDIPALLLDMCNKYGYPVCEQDHEWRRRKWVSFLGDKTNNRNINSIDTTVTLDREHDKYPVFSEFLIKLLYTLDANLIRGQYINSTDIKDKCNLIISEHFPDRGNVDWLFDIRVDDESFDKEIFMKKINKLIDYFLAKQSNNYNNGFIPILSHIKKNIK